MTDLGDHFYVVRMSNEDDYEKVLFGGPWLILDHYLTVQKWYPDFDCDTAPISKISVWIHVPRLSMEFFDKEILARIGNKLGRTLRVDETTFNAERGQFARISVEVDLSKPLQSSFYFRGKLRHLHYGGLHAVCFTYGRYGHKQESCPSTINTHADHNTTNTDSATGVTTPAHKIDEATPTLEEEFGSWMLAKKFQRRKKQDKDQRPSSEAAENLKQDPKYPKGNKVQDGNLTPIQGSRFGIL